MITRKLQDELITLAGEYPIVTLIGPRQSGKTTLAKMSFPHYKYCSLEDPDIRRYAQNDPRSFLKDYGHKVILDEIQRVPELLSYIQSLVDDKDENGEEKNGQFILTGSHQLKLRSEINQSLAGRTALLILLPLSLEELGAQVNDLSKEEILYTGLFPRIYNKQLNPTKAYANYYQTYVERDVRQLIHLKDVHHFEKFLKLLAGRVGQIVNLNSLANDVGVSSTTLKEWLSVLEASFIIFKLAPYFENFGKRVIKSPKIYFVDCGLLCYLLNIENPMTLKRDPLIGNIFENFVFLECMKARLNQGLLPNIYFYRDSNGNEVDLVYKFGHQLIPIEIKSAGTFNHFFEKGVLQFQKLTDYASTGYIIYNGDFFPRTDHYEVINFRQTYKIFNSK